MRKLISSFILTLIVILNNGLFCQQVSKRIENEHSSIHLAVGWQNTLFLDKHSIDDFGRRNTGIHGLREHLNYAYFSGTFCTKKDYCYSIDYRAYSKGIFGQFLKKGDVWERGYSTVNIGFGKTIYRTKAIALTPNVYLSSRFNGGEFVLLYYSARPPYALDVFYEYRSLGVGAGFSFRQKIYKGINVGLDLIYNHYFQRSIPTRSPIGYEDYVKNYKVNRNTLNLNITLGLLLNTSKVNKPKGG